LRLLGYVLWRCNAQFPRVGLKGRHEHRDFGGGSIKVHVIQSAYHVFHSGLERLLENAGGVGMLIATAIAAQTTDPRARIKLNPSSSDSRALGMLVSCDE
jgi:hypothetical protein